MAVKSLFNSARYPALQSVFSDGQGDESSLVDAVYDRILLRIVNGELPEGTELKGTQLAAELEVSRTPVIQALSRLVIDGIVVQHRHRRATVRPGAENWLVDVHNLRQVLEPHAAELAAGNVAEEVLGDLALLAREAQPSKEHAWTEAAAYFDSALHLTIAEYCGNLSMRSVIRQCWNSKRISYQAGADTERTLRRGYRDHIRILAALKSGDSATARDCMSEHLHSAAKLRSKDRIV